MLVNTYKNWPNPMESVSRRITVVIVDLRKLLDPMTAARSEAQSLLERIGYLADSLPEDLQDSSLSPEIQDYARRLTLTRLRLGRHSGPLAGPDQAAGKDQRRHRRATARAVEGLLPAAARALA